MGLEPGSQNRKPVPGKALLPTDDDLGHGEQDHPGVAELSCPSNPWPRPLGSPGIWLSGELKYLLKSPSWDAVQGSGHTEAENANSQDNTVKRLGTEQLGAVREQTNWEAREMAQWVRTLAAQAQGPEFRSLTPCKKQSVVGTSVTTVLAVWLETGRSRRLAKCQPNTRPTNPTKKKNQL